MQNDIVEIFSFYRKAGVEVIGIYAISDKGRLEIQELDLTSEGIIKRFRYNRLRELSMRGEGIYFAPIPKPVICFFWMLPPVWMDDRVQRWWSKPVPRSTNFTPPTSDSLLLYQLEPVLLSIYAPSITPTKGLSLLTTQGDLKDLSTRSLLINLWLKFFTP